MGRKKITDINIFDTSNIKCFKISNRSNPLPFVKNVIDSYMTNEVLKYLKISKNSYAYWGRAGYFWPHFKRINFEKVLFYKEELFRKKVKNNE